MKALVITGLLLAAPGVLFAQSKKQKEKAAEAAAALPPGPPLDPNYSYQPDGRRDPFINLIGAGVDPEFSNTRRGDGAAAFTVAEISVRGVIQSKGRLLAMVQGPDDKTYVVHAGDKLADGVVKNVTTQGLVVIQEINDPLSVQKQREVRKLLRSLEDEKE